MIIWWCLALVVMVLLALGLAGKALQVLAWVVLFFVALLILYAIFYTSTHSGV